MLLRLSMLGSCLVLATACSNGKKTDTADSKLKINFSKFSTVHFTYGSGLQGYQSYRLDLINGNLSGTWEHFETVDNANRKVTANSRTTLRSKRLELFKGAILDLNDRLASVDVSTCGAMPDYPVASLVLTNRTDAEVKMQVSEEQHLSASCADEYVLDGTFERLSQMFENVLPEPDASAFKPAENP